MQRAQYASDATRLTRRALLARGAAGLAGAALAPQILVLSNPRRATAQPPATDKPGKVVKFGLNVRAKTGAPDGRTRQFFTYNDELPGPTIRAQLGETLRIKVKNELDQPTSVHWHGMHQPGTWQMDGVSGVTQQPIAPGGEMIYEFEATPAGTHWYHSHYGVQYGDGLFGTLIVDEPTPPAKYDRDATLLINDWFLKPSEEILAELTKPKIHAVLPQQPDAAKPPGNMPQMKPADDKPAMPNIQSAPSADIPRMKDGGAKGMPGMSGGKPDAGDVPFESALINGRGRFSDQTPAPLSSVEVNPGETLRLRVINGSSTYSFRFQVDGHKLGVFATDGAPIAPVEVDNLWLAPGERYDVLLKADQKGLSWIRAVTLTGGAGRAMLRYPDAPAGEPAKSVEWGPQMLAPADLRSPARVELPKAREINLKLGGGMMPFVWTINDQAFPKADPVALAKDEWVRFVIENPTGMDHPFHLHGHYFYVLGKPDALNLTDPPQKDTINVPAKGTMVLQWKANNPGHWFFHCHIEWHVATGMARVVEIAEG